MRKALSQAQRATSAFFCHSVSGDKTCSLQEEWLIKAVIVGVCLCVSECVECVGREVS